MTMTTHPRLRKAETIDDVYAAFRYQPLQIDEIRDFYLDTQEARGGVPVRRRITRLLEKSAADYHHILLVGYKGCGKSTELNHLQKDLQHDYLVMNYSVMSELDPIHLNYIELFIVTLERFFHVAKENDLPISRKYIENILHWIDSKEITDIREKYNIGIEAEAGADGKIGIPFLQEFFYKFKLSAKSSRSLKELIKINIEPKLSELIEHCNLLINEVKLHLTKIRRKDILIIIEDLDKIPIDRAEDLFFNYANQLTRLRCNVVFTFPITAYYNIRFNTIKPYFSDTFELPMIKVAQPDGSVFSPGIELLKQIVARRMNPAIFEHEGSLLRLIKKSGGCIRDLFRLVAEAAENALDNTRSRIADTDCDNALLVLKREYANSIADNYRDGKKIEAEEYYNTLTAIAQSANKNLANTELQLDLRQNLCILGYNGEGWCDVHPIVKDILKDKGKWDGKQR